MKLYSYYRSSCSYRLRIALNLKGLEYDYIAVNLLKEEQSADEYRKLNPLGLVPALEVAPETFLGQSLAICEWLDEMHPTPALYPEEPLQRARVRAVVHTICSEIQPLCNSGVSTYLAKEHGTSEELMQQWYERWMQRGFIAVEQALAESATTFSFDDTPGMADLFLVPQVYNARRFGVPLEAYPNILRVVAQCEVLPAFADAAPEKQPDFPG